MSVREYTKILGSISDDQLQQALTHFDLGKLVSSSSIAFGLFGQNLFITSTKGEFVLRGHPHYDWQLPTEQYFAEQLHSKTGVPVPHPYLVDVNSHIFSWSGGYAIMPRLKGLALADPEVYKNLSLSEREGAAKAMGSFLPRMQKLTAERVGKYDHAAGRLEPFVGGYISRTVDRIRKLVDASTEYGAVSISDKGWIENHINELSNLKEPDQPVVVMEDFNKNNMVFGNDGGHWEVTGLFDLMTCHFGDGIADLPRQFSMFVEDDGTLVLAQAYISSYLEVSEKKAADVRSRGLLYLLDERMLVWEYFHRPNHSGGSWKQGETLQAWLEGFTEAWDKILSRA